MKRHVMTRAAAAVGVAGIGLAGLLGAAVAVPAGATISDEGSPAASVSMEGQGQDGVQAVSESALNLPGPNLILNPSFEDDDMSMWYLGGMAYRSSERSMDGIYSINWNGSFDVWSADIVMLNIEIIESGFYTFEYWVFTSGEEQIVNTNLLQYSFMLEPVLSVGTSFSDTGVWQHQYFPNICLRAGDIHHIILNINMSTVIWPPGTMEPTGGSIDNLSLTRTHVSEDCGPEDIAEPGDPDPDPDPIDPGPGPGVGGGDLGVLPLCPVGSTNVVGNPIFADEVSIHPADGSAISAHGNWVISGDGLSRTSAHPLVGTHSFAWLHDPFALPAAIDGHGWLWQDIDIPESGYHTFEFWTYVEQGSIQLQPILWSANGIHVVEHMTLDVDDSPGGWTRWLWEDIYLEAGVELWMQFLVDARLNSPGYPDPSVVGSGFIGAVSLCGPADDPGEPDPTDPDPGPGLGGGQEVPGPGDTGPGGPGVGGGQEVPGPGTPGATGPQGPQGPSGPQGGQGIPGTPGQDGGQGAPGAQGPQGQPGAHHPGGTAPAAPSQPAVNQPAAHQPGAAQPGAVARGTARLPLTGGSVFWLIASGLVLTGGVALTSSRWIKQSTSR